MSNQNKRSKSQVLYDVLISGVLLVGAGTSVYSMLDANQKMNAAIPGSTSYHKACEEMVAGTALGVASTSLAAVLSRMSLLKIPRRTQSLKAGCKL